MATSKRNPRRRTAMGNYESDTQTFEQNYDEQAVLGEQETAPEVPAEVEQEAAQETVETAEVNLEDMARDVVAALPTADQITPYQIHSVVNTLLEALGSDYTVRPQMMYNYSRNGMIVKGAKDRKRFTSQEVLDFVVKFVRKHTSTPAKA